MAFILLNFNKAPKYTSLPFHKRLETVYLQFALKALLYFSAPMPNDFTFTYAIVGLNLISKGGFSTHSIDSTLLSKTRATFRKKMLLAVFHSLFQHLCVLYRLFKVREHTNFAGDRNTQVICQFLHNLLNCDLVFRQVGTILPTFCYGLQVSVSFAMVRFT